MVQEQERPEPKSPPAEEMSDAEKAARAGDHHPFDSSEPDTSGEDEEEEEGKETE